MSSSNIKNTTKYFLFFIIIILLNACSSTGTSSITNSNIEIPNSPYTEIVVLPEYNASNPEHFKIETQADWEHINDSDKRVFFVSPNNYMDMGKIILNSSGTEQKRRYIILDNGNNLHPVQLEEEALAFYMLEMHDANYWVVDRQAMKPVAETLTELAVGETPYMYDDTFAHLLLRNELYASSHNIFDRCYMRDMANNYGIYENSNDNVIQNGKIFKTQWSVDNQNFGDLAAIGMLIEHEDAQLINTHILNMEIVNMVDAIQTIRIEDEEHTMLDLDYQGTIIDNNLLYITNILYTKGDGISDPDGDRAYAENAIDLKGGSKNPDNPILITHNKMWGYRFVDNAYSALSDTGNAMVLHYDVPSVIIKENLIFDSNIGIHSGGVWDVPAISNVTITNNIFHSMIENSIIIEGIMEEENYLASDNVSIDHNLFINNGYFSDVQVYNAKNVTVEENIFYEENETDTTALYVGNESGGDSGEVRVSDNLSFVNNTLYGVSLGNQPSWLILSGNTISDDSPDLSDYDFSYLVDRFSEKTSVLWLETK